MIEPLVVGLAFAAIFMVELPDKTFIATLVLSTKFRGLWVWLGVGAAFLVQTLIAVGLGTAASYLPTTLVQAAAALMFLVGAFLLLREARGADEEEPETEREYAEKVSAADAARQGIRAVATCFVVLFAAEWGDLSQLLTLSLVAKYDAPASVFLGAWGALLTVSGLAVIVGRFLLAHVRLSLLHYLGAAVCVLMAGLTLWEMTR